MFRKYLFINFSNFLIKTKIKIVESISKRRILHNVVTAKNAPVVHVYRDEHRCIQFTFSNHKNK